MLPNFTAPAYEFVALCTIRFRNRTDGSVRQVRSDYRCQLRYVDAGASAADYETRIHLVGQKNAVSGEDVPVLLSFLDAKGQRDRCSVGKHFELSEGGAVTASGTVHARTGT